MKKGITFATGRVLGTDLPVVFSMKEGNKPLLTTYWTPSDAEGIAYALLKQAELVRRWELENKSAVK